MHYASEGNIYIDKMAPWQLIKDKKETEARRTLYILLNLCKSLAIVSSPILPQSMQRAWTEQLNLSGSIGRKGIWDEAAKIDIPSDHIIRKPSPLYQRMDEKRLTELREGFSRPPSHKEILGGSEKSR